MIEPKVLHRWVHDSAPSGIPFEVVLLEYGGGRREVSTLDYGRVHISVLFQELKRLDSGFGRLLDLARRGDLSAIESLVAEARISVALRTVLLRELGA